MIPERDAALLRHVAGLHEAAMDATLPPARRRLSRMAARTQAEEAKGELDALLGPPAQFPPGLVRLDFEILPGEAGGEAERDRRARWIEHVMAHARELAAIAVEHTRGEPFHERVALTANRLAGLLAQGRSALGDTGPTLLDLASPGPNLTPWPDMFAGEPLPSSLAPILARPLAWTHLASLRLWARLLAYHASGLRPDALPSVAKLARRRLAKLLDAARRGLHAEARG